MPAHCRPAGPISSYRTHVFGCLALCDHLPITHCIHAMPTATGIPLNTNLLILSVREMNNDREELECVNHIISVFDTVLMKAGNKKAGNTLHIFCLKRNVRHSRDAAPTCTCAVHRNVFSHDLSTHTRTWILCYTFDSTLHRAHTYPSLFVCTLDPCIVSDLVFDTRAACPTALCYTVSDSHPLLIHSPRCPNVRQHARVHRHTWARISLLCLNSFSTTTITRTTVNRTTYLVRCLTLVPERRKSCMHALMPTQSAASNSTTSTLTGSTVTTLHCSVLSTRVWQAGCSATVHDAALSGHFCQSIATRCRNTHDVLLLFCRALTQRALLQRQAVLEFDRYLFVLLHWDVLLPLQTGLGRGRSHLLCRCSCDHSGVRRQRIAFNRRGNAVYYILRPGW